MKTCTITDILTEEEIVQARKLYRQLKDTGRFATEVCKTLIEPNMARINHRTGQENDPKYLAYAVEYVLSQAGDA